MPWEKQFSIEGVLDKAMQTFWVHGFEATSVQDLVACTGINRGSLYATYGDKRDLFLAALKHYDETVRKGLAVEMENRLGPREAIRQMFQAFVDRVAVQGRNCGCFLTNTALELAAHDAEIAAIVANAQTEMEDFFARSIARGQTQGEISPALDPRTVAQGLLATLQGLVVLSRSRPDPALLQAIADDALRRLT